MLFDINYFGERTTICEECRQKLEDSYNSTFNALLDEDYTVKTSEGECGFYIVPRCESRK